jgi:hypothetical protein
MMGKGSQFEREICTQLSRWWTDDARDDIFWRSSQSGGRATVRGRKGKSTFGHCGDVAAVDPIGSPLIEAVTIEIKRGYQHAALADLLERPKTAKQQIWEAWIQQAYEAQQRAGTPYWMIVAKRNQKQAIVVMPIGLFSSLGLIGRLSIEMRIGVRFKTSKKGPLEKARPFQLAAITLSHWFYYVNPNSFRS